jgi:hypothetical protein
MLTVVDGDGWFLYAIDAGEFAQLQLSPAVVPIVSHNVPWEGTAQDAMLAKKKRLNRQSQGNPIGKSKVAIKWPTFSPSGTIGDTLRIAIARFG